MHRRTPRQRLRHTDERRAHPGLGATRRCLIDKVNKYLKDYDLDGVDISIMKPSDAMRVSMERATAGKDTILVTGNVLRDYLTVRVDRSLTEILNSIDTHDRYQLSSPFIYYSIILCLSSHRTYSQSSN